MFSSFLVFHWDCFILAWKKNLKISTWLSSQVERGEPLVTVQNLGTILGVRVTKRAQQFIHWVSSAKHYRLTSHRMMDALRRLYPVVPNALSFCFPLGRPQRALHRKSVLPPERFKVPSFLGQIFWNSSIHFWLRAAMLRRSLANFEFSQLSLTYSHFDITPATIANSSAKSRTNMLHF